MIAARKVLSCLSYIYIYPIPGMLSSPNLRKSSSVALYISYLIKGFRKILIPIKHMINLYILLYVFRFAVTSWHQNCICISSLRSLQSLLELEMYLLFFFFPICGHFLAPELYLHLFFFAVCSHSWN